jgi:hypothetical protein
MWINAVKSQAMNCDSVSETMDGVTVVNFSRPPHDLLEVGFGHGLADLVVDDEPAVAIKKTGLVVDYARPS